MESQKNFSAPIPGNVSVDNHGTGLTLKYRWFSPKFIFLVFFCVFWDGFLIFWYTKALSTNAPMMVILFPLIHVSVGIGLTYYTLAGFLNSTIVDVTRNGITIYHTPLPWIGNKTIPVIDVVQLYREEIVSQSNNSLRIKYQLSAVSRENKKITVIGGIETAEVALFLEQEIEQWLGIKDVKVAGEMQK